MIRAQNYRQNNNNNRKIVCIKRRARGGRKKSMKRWCFAEVNAMHDMYNWTERVQAHM